MSYSLYEGIIPKIEEKLKKLRLRGALEAESLVKDKKRFYRTFAEKDGKKIFFKSLLSEEKGIKERFVNEINFYRTLKENPLNPLNKFTPNLLEYSLYSFPFLVYEFILGEAKDKRDKFTKEELKEIVALLEAVRNSSVSFEFEGEQNLFSFNSYKEKITLFLKNLNLGKEIKERIENFTEKNKGIFKSTKSSLSHGDFSEANLIFYGKEVKLIDWEHVNLRNPLYDLAGFFLRRKGYEDEKKILFEESLLNFKDKGQFLILFKLSLLEIALSDLNLFRESNKERLEKEKSAYLEIIKKYILDN